MELPTGTVTFLFTDIEGSTRLLQELRDGYRAVQDAHARIMRAAIDDGGGIAIKTEGDSFFAVFAGHAGALRAAVGAQRALVAHDWPHGEPLRVRMGMHTGEGVLGGDDYLGIDVNRAARIAAAGHGGQILISEATRSLIQHDVPEGVAFRDLGERRLKDIAHPEHLSDLVIEGLPSEFPPIKTLEVPTNLPAQLTSFVGREQQVAQVIELLERSALVTLTGPGGTGKTRLAVEAAARRLEGFPDGVFFVDLSAITDPQLVPDTIVSALRLRPERSGRQALEILTEHLRDRAMLLVLDNFEQILSGAETVAATLRAAPRVRVLATSRAPLGLSGEQVLPVPPLEVPDPDGDPVALRRSEAVALFVERATAVAPAFTLTEEEIPVVAEICARLDGLPLAIELAASRIRMFPPSSLLQQLERRLPMLVGGPRNAPDRQRTLGAAIAWGHDLLDEPVRTLFRRLAVFAGGWTLEAAGEIANPQRELGDTVEMAELLLQHSLVQRVPHDREGRLRMLETIREFGVDRLEESGEADDVRLRHARRSLELVEEAEGYLTGPDQRRWLDLLSLEHDNLRAALAWAIAGERPELALRLTGALWRFWYARGHLEEGRRLLEASLSMASSAGRAAHRAKALAALGGITYWQSDFTAASVSYEEALEIHRERDDRASIVQALQDVGTTRAVGGDPQSAMALVQESLEMARSLGDRRGEAWALWGLGAMRMFGGDITGARGHFEESARIFEEVRIDTWGLGNAYAGLAALALQLGEPNEARRLALRGIDLWDQQGNALVLAGQIRFLAIVANELGDHGRGARLAGAAEAWRSKVAGQIPDAFFPFDDPRETAARVLDEATMTRLLSEGGAMSLEEALTYAREDA